MDASQVYRDLRVLSARPSEAEEAAAPHQLFGYLDGTESCSAARWAADAKAAIAESAAAGRLPILVGGTGLYLRTLLDGIAPVPEIDPQVRADIRALAVRDAYAALSREDPAAAARLSPNDTTRVARALEVVRSTGRPLADWQKDKLGGIGDQIDLMPMILLPPRDWLYARCDARFVQMMDAGLDEVAALLARGLDPDLPVMRAIGVPELADHLAGRLSRDAALAAAQMATRNYAKRQFTWFRNQPPPEWRRIEDELDVATIDQLAIILRDEALT
ncbi:MAG: tRNA delta(2)-isopentenylpyrophosphate transferase [Pseudomonadota bacterium]